ncbi:MAG: hypothetical protein U5O39_19070 [Gammaproteobacteria bacterium]|nr:hypothetical protein [Gammaproteobacteria bacterium]
MISVLETVSADSLSLTAGGGISDVEGASISVFGKGQLVAKDSVVLGDTAPNPVNFGTLDITAASVSLVEQSSMNLIGLDVSGDVDPDRG